MIENKTRDAPSKMFHNITAEVMVWHLCDVNGYGKYYVPGFNTV